MLKFVGGAVAVLLAVVGTAQANLAVVNGDFNSGMSGTDQGAISGWYSATPANFWEAAWQVDRAYPNFTGSPSPYVGLAGPASFAPSITTTYLYQDIGTKDPTDAALGVSFELGSFADADPTRQGTMTVSLIQLGPVGNNFDIGSTVIDSFSVYTGALAPTDVIPASGVLDLTAANTTDPIYLYFSWAGELGQYNNGYMAMDNVGINVIPVPEPTSLVLAGLGVVLLFARRRRAR